MEENDYIRLFDKFLQKQATPEETRSLIRWLENDAGFFRWADREWQAAPSQLPPELKQRLYHEIKAKIQSFEKDKKRSRIERRKFYRWSVHIAATLFFLLTTGLNIYLGSLRDRTLPDTIVAVEKGQKANVILPDGSKVWVNSDSRLIYGSRFSSKERVLHLEGEAYFEVAPDKNRPFIVEADPISVQALGTTFDVKNYRQESHISTVLMTGKVEVRSAKECLILHPNEKATFDKATGAMRKSPIGDAAGYGDWKFNILSFHAETFESIVRTLERYYNTRILFGSESLKKYRFTGSLKNTSLESILQILSLTSPLSYEVTDSVILLKENIRQKAYYENALK